MLSAADPYQEPFADRRFESETMFHSWTPQAARFILYADRVIFCIFIFSAPVEILVNSLSVLCNLENLYLNWNIVFVLMRVFLEIILELIPGVWWWLVVECVVCTDVISCMADCFDGIVVSLSTYKCNKWHQRLLSQMLPVIIDLFCYN